jgi:DNA-directed RNA polymerase specialized sigma24 family protein
MTQGDAPATMPVDEVCRRCVEETARYRRRESHDDRFCFHLFRRAITAGDDVCWQALTEVYRDLVAAWCRRAGANEPDLDELITLAWEKFWQHYTAEKLAGASGTAGVLRYLQLCAQSVVLDSARARPRELLSEDAAYRVPDTAPLPAETLADAAGRADFWNLVQEHLRDDRERTLLYLMYELGLRSAEIQAERPDLFPDVKMVYSTTRNVHDRLGRSPRLRQWLAVEGGAA